MYGVLSWVNFARFSRVLSVMIMPDAICVVIELLLVHDWVVHGPCIDRVVGGKILPESCCGELMSRRRACDVFRAGGDEGTCRLVVNVAYI